MPFDDDGLDARAARELREHVAIQARLRRLRELRLHEREDLLVLESNRGVAALGAATGAGAGAAEAEARPSRCAGGGTGRDSGAGCGSGAVAQDASSQRKVLAAASFSLLKGPPDRDMRCALVVRATSSAPGIIHHMGEREGNFQRENRAIASANRCSTGPKLIKFPVSQRPRPDSKKTRAHGSVRKETLPVSLEEEMRRSYLDYAMSVIVGRALPDVRDGLKPVHRRVLFAMFETNNVWNRPYVKCARVVGDVLGKYHPHGDNATYEALVRMAQDFSMRYTLIDGQGNFGSIDGDPPRPTGITECRLDRVASEILADIEKETVDFVPNYDGKSGSPPRCRPRSRTCLSTALRNSRGHGDQYPAAQPGRGGGRLPGLVEETRHDYRRADQHMPAPDFPTAGIIYGVAGVREGYRTAAPHHHCARARISRTSRRATGRRSSSTRFPTR